MTVGSQQQPQTGFFASITTLLASSSTLICCALPALMVALGMGATLSGLVSAFPQIVWISEHKDEIFLLSIVLTAFSGFLQWKNRNAPCPIDPALRNACLRTRKVSRVIYWLSLLFLCVGAWFAYIQVWLTS
jgi:hypothetical protein